MEEAALNMTTSVIDVDRHRYPHCIVWTPLPLLRYVLIYGNLLTCIRQMGYMSQLCQKGSMVVRLDPRLLVCSDLRGSFGSSTVFGVCSGHV